jgi:O-acetyl-ADP-ribose deacetylase (regulator of RNase III)
MIYEVTCDILLSCAAAIVHGVAPNDDFNQGLAHSLREQFPSLYKDFRHYCHSSHPKEGELWMWSGTTEKGSVRIINLFTQSAPEYAGAHAGKAKLSYVNHALRELKHLLEKENIPRLASGVGGLDWSDVFPLISEHLHHLDIPIYVYSTFKTGIAAKEPKAKVALA